MNSKTILVVLILGFVSLSIAEDVATKHKKSFAKLNKRLEEEVQSDDPISNRAALKKLLDDKSGGLMLHTSSYMDTLKKLIDFTELEEELFVCRAKKNTIIAEELDSGLADESRKKTPNYPLTRIDKIFQHYALINAEYCRFSERVPVLKFGYKQQAYKQIDEMLVKELPDNKDIDANMAKAEELLKNLEPKDGALADALEQLLQLKLTLNEDTCNERGHEILHKNSMATRLPFFSRHMTHKILDRVDKIYFHYAEKHEQLCRPVFVETFKAAVKDLNPNTYRKVLGLTSARLLDSSDYSKSIEEMNQKEIDGNFFTPTLAQRVEEKLAEYHTEDAIFDVNNIYTKGLNSRKQIDYLRGVTQGTPDSEFLTLQVDEQDGHKYVDEDKIKQIVKEHLVEPCHDYLKSLGETVRTDLYDANINPNHKRCLKGKAMEELTYHFVHYAYATCRMVIYDEQLLSGGIKYALLPMPRPVKLHS